MIMNIDDAKKYFDNCDRLGLAMMSKLYSIRIPIRYDEEEGVVLSKAWLNYRSMTDLQIITSANQLESMERKQSRFENVSADQLLQYLNNI